jgi:hypothetical protein
VAEQQLACAELYGMATGVDANGNTAHRDRLRDSGVEVGGWMRGASAVRGPCAGGSPAVSAVPCAMGTACYGHRAVGRRVARG